MADNGKKKTITNSRDMVEGKLYRALNGTGNTFMVVEVNPADQYVSIYNVTTMHKTAIAYDIATPEMEVLDSQDS